MQDLMRNLLLGGGGGFSPQSLFTGGVEGALYDPSDLSTLYQDSAGTTPVTGVEQVVGLMLDKSKNLALGPELVTNGDFSSGTTTGWTAVLSSISVVSGAMRVDNTSDFGRAWTSIPTVVGKTYYFSGVSSRVAGAGLIYAQAANNSSFTVNNRSITDSNVGTKSGFFVASATTTYIAVVGSTTADIVDWDNISVRELPGNHATSTGSARPTLSARVNRLERTEEISNAYWTKTQLASFAASGVTPNGVTAFNLVPNTNVDSHRLSRSAINIAGPKTMRVVAKANGYNFLSITDLTTFSAGIDLTTGTQWGGAGTAVITSLGNGWWEIKVSGTATASTSFAVEPLSSASFLAYAGDGVSGVLVGEFDDRFSNIGANVPAYQRIADANTYDTSGFPLYLRFDGIDDSMYTPANLNLSGTDKVAVFAGVRKLSDAALGMLVELSSLASSNNGAFAIGAPGWSPVASQYGSMLDATVTGEFANSPASFSAPITNVLTNQFFTTGSTQADRTSLRVNGAAQTLTFTNNTTASGNFGTYPLYIGSRNNSSLRLNGHLHSLIIAGSAVSAGNISATEQWVAGRTGIQI